MTTRLRPGHVIAVPTTNGTGYIQYVSRIKPYGALIRVLPGIYAEPPSDLQALANQAERFWVFFPLAATVNRGTFEVVGLAEIPSAARTMPLMKNPNGGNRPWEALTWWLWDGVNSWRTDRDDPRLFSASPMETWNDTMLIERMADGWKPADDLVPPRKREAS